ncbi:MAG: maleylpyruvate isomerase N-terminal domain-containing protein, partial [Acidimicrobiales bacterium]
MPSAAAVSTPSMRSGVGARRPPPAARRLVRLAAVVAVREPGGVDTDLDDRPDDAIELCVAAHHRLLGTVGHLGDEHIGAPSRLPHWTVGHVLTHLARNADGHVVRLEGALRGEDVRRYPGGVEQRDADIEAGASRPAT